MAYEIKGRLSLKLVFNDDEFLFERANSLDFIHMVASTKLSVPMLHFAVQDNVGFINEARHLADSARIQIVLSAGDSKAANTYVFRLNSFHRTPNSGAERFEIDAYPDCSTYWHSSAVEPVKGTSSRALAQIASRCGLEFNGEQTTDDQLWLPRNLRYHEWARHIATHGFRSDTSCMQYGMNLDRSLVYRDISVDAAPVMTLNYGGYKAGTVLITDAVPTTAAGAMNHHTGYSSQVVEQDSELADIYKHNKQVQVNLRADAGSLQVNARVKKAVERASVQFAPIDVGNTHPEFAKAAYQNARVNNLFTSRLSVLTPEPTGLGLLDTVTVTMDRSRDYLKTYSGDYRVASRTIRVEGNQYFEKLELLRKTLNGNAPTSV